MDSIKRSSIIFAVVVVLGAAGFAWSKTGSFPSVFKAKEQESSVAQDQDQEHQDVGATSSATNSENAAIRTKDTDDDDKQVGKEHEREDEDDRDDDDDDGGKVAGTPQTTPPPAVTPGKSYTMAQVATHNSQSNCWSVVDNNVYDLTSWIGQHPGGESAILGMCGKDGSSAFHGQHGNNAKQANALVAMKIGVLAQ